MESGFRHNVIMHALVMLSGQREREREKHPSSNCNAAILEFWHSKTNLNLFHNPWIAKVIESFNESDPYLNISEFCNEERRRRYIFVQWANIRLTWSFPWSWLLQSALYCRTHSQTTRNVVGYLDHWFRHTRSYGCKYCFGTVLHTFGWM